MQSRIHGSGGCVPVMRTLVCPPRLTPGMQLLQSPQKITIMVWAKYSAILDYDPQGSYWQEAASGTKICLSVTRRHGTSGNSPS